MQLPKTKRVGYVALTLRELSQFMNGELRVPREYRLITICAIHKQEGKVYTEPTFVLIIAGERLAVVGEGEHLREYSMEWENAN